MTELTGTEQNFLLSLARWTIAEKLGLPVSVDIAAEVSARLPEHPILAEQRGAFVTIRRDGELRGCIGNMVGMHPLHRTIRNMAEACAFQDPRFPSVERNEFPLLRIEISVLSPLVPVEDPKVLVPGKHGLYITKGYNSGVLLPQVATEQGWNTQEFLTHTCYKAGLTAEALNDPDTEFRIFTAQIFLEE